MTTFLVFAYLDLVIFDLKFGIYGFFSEFVYSDFFLLRITSSSISTKKQNIFKISWLFLCLFYNVPYILKELHMGQVT